MFPLPPYPEFNELAEVILAFCCFLAVLPGNFIFRVPPRGKPRKILPVIITAMAVIPPLAMRFMAPWITIRYQPITQCWFYPILIFLVILPLEAMWFLRRERRFDEAIARDRSPRRSG